MQLKNSPENEKNIKLTRAEFIFFKCLQVCLTCVLEEKINTSMPNLNLNTRTLVQYFKNIKM